MKIRRSEVVSYVNQYIQNCKSLGDGYSFNEIKEYCANTILNVNFTRINEFLKEKAKEAGIDMDEDLGGYGCITLTGKQEDENLIKKSWERFKKQIERSKYKFNSIDLKYFSDCFKIYKGKCLKLCFVIEMLQRRIRTNRELLKSLDISYNADFVSSEDVDRIIKPLITLYLRSMDVQSKAENLNTYLTVTLDPTSMHRDGISYSECLPSEDLQWTQSPMYAIKHPELFVELTEKQKQQIEEKEEANWKATAQFIVDLWN